MRVCIDWFPKGSFRNQTEDGFEFDDNLFQQVKIMVKNIVDDWDFTIIITGQGRVRVGKSTLAMQIAAVWLWLMEKEHKIKLPFTLKDNVIFNYEKLIEKGNEIGSLHPYMPFIYDEAGETLDSTKTMSPELKAVKDWLRECGQYNFLNILVLPEFFDLPKGIAITRSSCLIDVQTSVNEEKFVRGYFRFYSPFSKKRLYINGKKELNYNAFAYDFEGRYSGVFPFNKEEYIELKRAALRSRETRSNDETKEIIRALCYILYKEGLSSEEIVRRAHNVSHGKVNLKGRTIRDYFKYYDELNSDNLEDEEDKEEGQGKVKARGGADEL